MPVQILQVTTFEVNTGLPTLPAPVGIIQYTDTRLQMSLKAAVYDGYVDKGRAYLVIRPLAQHCVGRWIACDVDDCAFAVDVNEMRDIVEVAS